MEKKNTEWHGEERQAELDREIGRAIKLRNKKMPTRIIKDWIDDEDNQYFVEILLELEQIKSVRETGLRISERGEEYKKEVIEKIKHEVEEQLNRENKRDDKHE